MGWLNYDVDWWSKEGWIFGVQVFGDKVQKLREDRHGEFQLQDVSQYVVAVDCQPNWVVNPGASFSHAIKSNKISRLPNLHTLINCNLQNSAECLSSALLPSLRTMEICNEQIGIEDVKYLGHALRSGELKNLRILRLKKARIGDQRVAALAESFQEGMVGTLPNLEVVDRGFCLRKVTRPEEVKSV
jgi:hypothetical protein